MGFPHLCYGLPNYCYCDKETYFDPLAQPSNCAIGYICIIFTSIVEAFSHNYRRPETYILYLFYLNKLLEIKPIFVSSYIPSCYFTISRSELENHHEFHFVKSSFLSFPVRYVSHHQRAPDKVLT